MIGRISGAVGLSLALLALAEGQVGAQTRDRGQVEARDTWKLEDVYPSDQAWDQARKELAGQFDGILAFKGQLAGSSARLLECLEMNSRISKELSRLGCYASMKSDQDARNATYQGLKQQIEQISTDYSSKASFIEPEIAAMDKAVVDGFMAKEKGLAIYRMTIDDILRTKAHRLSDKEEKILAETGLLAGTPTRSSLCSVMRSCPILKSPSPMAPRPC